MLLRNQREDKYLKDTNRDDVDVVYVYWTEQAL